MVNTRKLQSILISSDNASLTVLENELSKNESICVSGKYNSYELMKYSNNQLLNILEDIDVAFLDIHDYNNIEMKLASSRLYIQRSLLIVFISTHNKLVHHRAVKAFDLNATDYILKPIQPERLRQTVKKLWNEI